MVSGQICDKLLCRQAIFSCSSESKWPNWHWRSRSVTFIFNTNGGCIFGANLVIQAKNCNTLSCTGTRWSIRTDGQMDVQTVPLKCDLVFCMKVSMPIRHIVSILVGTVYSILAGQWLLLKYAILTDDMDHRLWEFSWLTNWGPVNKMANILKTIFFIDFCEWKWLCFDQNFT